MEQGHFRQEHWRKSAQWSALVRKHAQVVADDVAVADVFSKTCRAGIDAKSGIEYKCVSDEVRGTSEAGDKADCLTHRSGNPSMAGNRNAGQLYVILAFS